MMSKDRQNIIGRKTVIALAVANVLSVQSVMAEEANVDEDKTEIITVTSAKRVQNIQEVPVAVTSVSGDTLADLQITDILSLEKAVPGLTMASYGNSPKAVLRGAGSAGTNDVAVPIYHNGMYLPSSGQALAGYLDVERVEVLRGPQGTLFGRNTFGGLINVITKKPELGEFEFGAALSVGDYSLRKLEGFVNVPLGDTLALRVTAADEERDPYVENINNPDGGLKDSDYSYFRAQVLFQPTDDFSINIGTSKWEDTGNGNLNWGYKSIGVPLSRTDPTQIDQLNGYLDPRMGIAVGCADGDRAGGRSQAGNVCDPNDNQWAGIVDGDYTIDYDYTPNRKLEETAFYLNLSWDVAGHNFNVNAASFEYESINIMDADYSGKESWIDGTYGTRNSKQADFTITSTHDSKFQYTVGAYFFDDTDNDNKSAYIFGSLTESWYAYEGATPETPSWAYWNNEGISGSKSTAIYGQATYSLTDKLNVTAGVRHTKDKRESISSNSLGWGDWLSHLGPELPTYSYEGKEKTIAKDDNTDYRLGVDYAFEEDIMLYATYSTAYIGGTYSSTTDSITEPQENKVFEAGVKSTLLDGSLVFNAAAYYGNIEGLTTTDFIDKGDGVAVAVSVPGGSIISQGLEFEGYWYATENVSIDFGVSLDMSEYDEFNVGAGNLVVDGVQPPGSVCTQDVCSGNQVFVMDGENTPYTPDVTVGLGINYDMDLGDMGTLTPSIFAYYNSGYDTARTPTFFTAQDAYTKIDLGVKWQSQDGDWVAKFWVNNATDETIATYTEILSKARAARDYAAPITWGLRVGYNF